MTKKLRIIADENIPALAELLSEHATISYLPGREICNDDLAQADVLLVRSITQVNAALLANTPVKFVGSCTIGTDHIDIDYLTSGDIAFANAPGCNADAVVDYVVAAMLYCQPNLNGWQGKIAGIVGLGQVGGRLKNRLQALGLSVLAYDPFVAAAKNTYAEVLQADVVSFHVPITKDGSHPTWQMLGENELAALKPDAVLINSCRGAVFDNSALQDYIDATNPCARIVLDVYEDEPNPNEKLLHSIDIATAHTAGYSVQGKIRGSLQVAEALLAYFHRPPINVDLLAVTKCNMPFNSSDTIAAAYDIKADSTAFIQQFIAAKGESERAQAFDRYRKNYPLKCEWAYITPQGLNVTKPVLKALGFGLV